MAKGHDIEGDTEWAQGKEMSYQGWPGGLRWLHGEDKEGAE